MGEQCDTQFLAVYPLPSLSTTFPTGKVVRLNARKREDGRLEATAVWMDGPHPPGYRGSALVCQLDHQAREQLFAVSGRPEHKTNPLSGASDHAVSARVAEYLTEELGLLHLEAGDGGAVLFHLNQVWERNIIKVRYNIQHNSLRTSTSWDLGPSYDNHCICELPILSQSCSSIA